MSFDEADLDGTNGPLQGDESQDSQTAKAKAALAELSQKIVQLTKVIVFLHTRSDGHEARMAAIKAEGNLEVKQVAASASRLVEEQRKETAKAVARRDEQVARLERRYAERVQEAQRAALELREAVRRREDLASATVKTQVARKEVQVTEIRRQAERVRCELSAAEVRARGDQQWLARQIAAETLRQRREMDERFELKAAHLRLEQSELLDKLKREKEVAVAAQRVEHTERRESILAEVEAEHTETLARQERGFQAERRFLQERLAAAQARLASAHNETLAAKEECMAQQRLLDEISRELQERKRQGQVLTQEADRVHSQKLKADTEARELRRKKVAIERTLIGASVYGAGPGTEGQGASAEKAMLTLSEDLRLAQSRAQALRSEVAQRKRALQERQVIMADREQRAEVLSKDLMDERRRSDELQLVLLRLDQRL